MPSHGVHSDLLVSPNDSILSLNHQKACILSQRLKEKWKINYLQTYKKVKTHSSLNHETETHLQAPCSSACGLFHVCSAPGGFFHRDSLCIDTCFSAPSVYSVQTQTLYNTLLFTTVQNQQTPWISSAASSGFWQLLFQVTEEKDAHFWLFNVDLIWWNTYNVVVRSIQRSHCDSAWSSDCFWRTRRHYRV